MFRTIDPKDPPTSCPKCGDTADSHRPRILWEVRSIVRLDGSYGGV